jgi:hypothetical protein
VPAAPSCQQKLKTFNRKGGFKMAELTPLVAANLGFPIVVSLYLLVRVERKLDELTKCIKEVYKTIAKIL